MILSRRLRLGIAILAIAATLYIVLVVNELGGVSVPRPDRLPRENVEHLAERQGWPRGWDWGQAGWFHHTSQGTRILPYDWFISLEQPALLPLGRFCEEDYLTRFGFLPSEPDPRLNPDGLPVGFAIDRDYDAPYANPSWSGPVVGLTCAACHTGQLTFRDASGNLRGIRVEGGSAMIHLAAFQDALGRALGYTLKINGRFDTFARRVLKDQANDPQRRATLRGQVQSFLDAGLKLNEYTRVHKLAGTPAGFGRTDALALIGNRVFRAFSDKNLVVASAPVNFPPLWDTPWFDWVQYNASIRMPMVRNIGEALGVGAAVNLTDLRTPLYASTVNVRGLHEMESQLGGDRELSGLQAPRWRDTFLPPPEPARVERGAELYRRMCQHCHLPPMDALRAELATDQPEHWETDPTTGRRFLKLTLCDLNEIGTDPGQARNLANRAVTMNRAKVSVAVGLYAVTGMIRRDRYAALGLDGGDPAARQAYDRFRTFSADRADRADLESGRGINEVLVANLGYKARPLDGVWATPPYLHNGSVPSLDQLLRPAAQRDRDFTLGSTRFDPVRVGFSTDDFPGGTRLDTTIEGNHNTGHEFRNLTLAELERFTGHHASDDDPEPTADRWARVLVAPRSEVAAWPSDELWRRIRRKTLEVIHSEPARRDHPFPGVIGPELTETERRDLIEYLKTL